MLFTCITPSFRQLEWLRLCIASVRDQVSAISTSPAFPIAEPFCIEHIVQDAGSPGIEDFARDVGAEFYRDGNLVFRPLDSLNIPNSRYTLVIHCERDAGMYDAVNQGLKRGTGALYAYLNCDEQYLPNTIPKICAEFERHPECEIIFGDAILVKPDGSPLSYRQAVLPEKAHVRLCHLNTLTCSTFFRRSVLERGIYFGDAWKIIGDAVWVYRCLEEGCSMRVLNEPMSTFCFTGQNLSEQDMLRSESEQTRWSKAPGAPARWLKPLASLWHRLRKALSGAYRHRDVDYAIHTIADRNTRTRFSARNLGSGWPGQTSGIV